MQRKNINKIDKMVIKRTNFIWHIVTITISAILTGIFAFIFRYVYQNYNSIEPLPFLVEPLNTTFIDLTRPELCHPSIPFMVDDLWYNTIITAYTLGAEYFHSILSGSYILELYDTCTQLIAEYCDKAYRLFRQHLANDAVQNYILLSFYVFLLEIIITIIKPLLESTVILMTTLGGSDWPGGFVPGQGGGKNSGNNGGYGGWQGYGGTGDGGGHGGPPGDRNPDNQGNKDDKDDKDDEDDEDDSSDEEEYESSEVDMTTYDNMRYYHFYNPTNLMLAPGVRYYRGGLGQGGGAFFFDQEPWPTAVLSHLPGSARDALADALQYDYEIQTAGGSNQIPHMQENMYPDWAIVALQNISPYNLDITPERIRRIRG